VAAEEPTGIESAALGFAFAAATLLFTALSLTIGKSCVYATMLISGIGCALSLIGIVKGGTIESPLGFASRVVGAIGFAIGLGGIVYGVSHILRGGNKL
jgi:hypothetical protein